MKIENVKETFLQNLKHQLQEKWWVGEKTTSLNPFVFEM